MLPLSAFLSEEWGETPVAFVVSGNASAGEIKDFVNARVGETQRLADVQLTTDLPRSHTGKVLKRELREAILLIGVESGRRSAS